MHILFVLWLAVAVVYVLPKFVSYRYTYTPKQPETSVIKLFDGPYTDTVHEVPVKDQPDYLVTPYMPMDENGMPIPDEENIIHSANGMIYVKPSLAYYQQVTDDEYIYVRDINEDELNKIRVTGELPAYKAKDE